MPSTALFVIDIQNLMCGEPSTEIPGASRIQSAGTALLARARSSISAARAAGREPDLSIVFVQHEETDDPQGLVRGTKRWELYFKPDTESPDERLVAKTTQDTFESNPALADELKAQGVKEIVSFGIQSECCVRSTSKGALAAGLGVTLLQGAHGTYNTETKTADEIGKNVETELAGLGAKVIPWEQWTV